MARIEINNYKFYQDKNGLSSLILEGRDLPAELAQLSEHNLSSIDVNGSFHQGRIKDLEFLKDYPYINRVWVCRAWEDPVDCSGLYYLNRLEEVGGEIDQHIDYSRFPMLHSLRVNWWKGFPDLSNNTRLKQLMFRSFNPIGRCLSVQGFPPGIESFELVFSNISDLEGLPAGVVNLQLAYCRNLQSLRGLESSLGTLRSIEIQNCRKLTDYHILGACSELEKVMIDNGGEMNSLGWIKGLKNLKHFVFFKTHIADGNLDPLFKIPYVYFTNSKDYNHRMKEFDSYNWFEKNGKETGKG